MSSSWIIAAVRTPLGKFLGELSPFAAPLLASHAVNGIFKSTQFPRDLVNEVILGQVLQAGVGQAPARQAALLARLSVHTPACTINKVCGSGLKAIMLANQAIRVGDAQAIVAGGMESMSMAPHLLPNSRIGSKFGEIKLLDAMQYDGLTCATERSSMGEIAEQTAATLQISRASQDDFAVASQQKAAAAREQGKFNLEICPIEVHTKAAVKKVCHDENIRVETSLAGLAKLPPAFTKEGTVTAGNASQLSDGAAAVLVVNDELANMYDSPVKAKIIATASTSRAPKDLFLAPVDAIRAVLAKANLTLDEIDLIELNEAFAVQCLACVRELNIPPEKLNVHGGAIALGHPIGASGARILVTLLHALAQYEKRYGLAALCLGGGGAVAMIVERVQN
jgi:acetyl-CoA C-acetyltransferase